MIPKNKDRTPIFYKDAAEMDKPLSVLVEELRSQVSKIRGKLADIRYSYGWDDRIEHLEGGFTCMLVAMYGTMKEMKEFEDKNNAQTNS